MHPTTPLVIPLALVSTQEPKAPTTGPAERTAGGAPGSGTAQPQPAPGPSQGPCGMDMMLMLPLLFVVMWFMVLGPERKRKKEAQQMLSSLKAGDRIVSIGGVHGVVHSLEERTITVRVDTIRMVLDRSAIARVLRDEVAKEEVKKP
jgi:preprotein translocase subunit YajC